MPTKKEKQPLSVTHPELAKEADGWDPNEYTFGSMKKCRWKCDNGHTWLASVYHRVKGTGCPFCAGKVVLRGFNDLETTHPAISEESVSGPVTDFTRGSAAVLKWRCPRDHIYEVSIEKRVKGRGCPICANRVTVVGVNDLVSTHPEVARESFGWNPRDFIFGSSKIKIWKCNKGHVYQASIVKRTSKDQGCPYCTGHQVWFGFNDLNTTHPQISSEAIQGLITNLSAGSQEIKKWKCPEGHIYSSRIANRALRDQGCPFCSGHKIQKGFNDLSTTHPDLAKELVNLDGHLVSMGSKKRLKWRCEDGHEWVSDVAHRVSGRGCPSCSKTGFDPNRSGYLYLLQQSDWETLQIGISNDPDTRLSQHKKLGWALLELRGPMDGHLTQQWETAILRMLKAKGADLSNAKIAGKFDGYSEAWSKSTFEAKSIKELMRLTEEFEGK